jgi:hypothetical protein
MKRSIFMAASAMLGFFAMIPLALLFDRMNWPAFQSWGLVHGSFLIAWPFLSFVSFGILRLIPAFNRRSPQDTARKTTR